MMIFSSFESTLGDGKRRRRRRQRRSSTGVPSSHSMDILPLNVPPYRSSLLGVAWMMVCAVGVAVVARTTMNNAQVVSAFSPVIHTVSSSSSSKSRLRQQQTTPSSLLWPSLSSSYHYYHNPKSRSTTRRYAVPDQDDGSIINANDSFAELTSALALASKSTGRNSRWERLVLPSEQENEEENDETIPTIAKEDEEFVWVLEPSDVIDGIRTEPSCTIVFTGGAGLGQYPHVAYNELLQRISQKLNAVIITVPYNIGLDHFELAKTTGEKLRRGIQTYDNKKRRNQTSTNNRRPVYALAHSLGCKLQTIYLAATQRPDEWDGYGFMAFNNFGFSQTIQMARSFTDEIRRGSTSTRSGRAGSGGMNADDDVIGDRFTTTSSNTASNNDFMSNIFDLAEIALGVVGIDFSPNAQDTNRLIQLRYNPEFQSKTRLFVMDDDNMDSSSDFIEDCHLHNNNNNNNNRSTNNNGQQNSDNSDNNNDGGVTVSGISGRHLAPVYFEWNVDDAMTTKNMDDLPPEAREMAKEAMGGFRGASFGDEVALNELVDEFCSWIMGRGPTRGPKSSSSTTSGSSSSSKDINNYKIAGS